MSVLIWGFTLFAVAFLLHVAVWRIINPANTVKILLIIFSLILFAGMIALVVLARIYPGLSILPGSSVSYIRIFLLYFSLSVCYIISYPAVEADSPSLAMVLSISHAGRDGMPCENMKKLFNDDLLVEPRIKDLVDAGLADLVDSRYKINKRGAFFVFPFIIYRNFLGLGKGG